MFPFNPLTKTELSYPQLPEEILKTVLVLVVLEDGDAGILNLALTCQSFNKVVCQPAFLQEAHFAWLDSKWNNVLFGEGFHCLLKCYMSALSQC